MPPSDLDDNCRHWNFLHSRVMPRIYKDMGEECQGFFDWLAEQDPDLYARIETADKNMHSLCHPEAAWESFNAACKTWYNLLMEAKKEFDAWKLKQKQDAELVGTQERMAM